MSLDLSNPADFSRITQQGLGDIIRLIDGRDPNEWDLVESSYNGIVFHVFQSKQPYKAAVDRVSDTLGRRKVKLSYPYRDGQTTDDLGRKAANFRFDIVFHGPNYYEGLNNFLDELDKPEPGTLVHPIRGPFQCVGEDIEVTYESNTSQAAILTVTFTEHNFTIGRISERDDPTVKGALSKALAIFRTVDAIINKVEQVDLFVRGVQTRIATLLAAYKASNAAILTAMNATFNGGLQQSQDIPSLVPVNNGGTRNPDGTVTDDTFVVVRAPSDPFEGVPVSVADSTTATALAVQQLNKQVIALREEAGVIIQELIAGGGALEFFEDIIGMRETVVLVQDVYDKGVASSNAFVIEYVVPRVMSLREAAFENGISPQRVQELDMLNPNLLSVNHLEKGQIILVPNS